MAAPVYIPDDSAQGFLFSTSSPTLVVSCVFNVSHADRCEVVSHCVLICVALMISDEHLFMCVGHLHVFFFKKDFFIGERAQAVGSGRGRNRLLLSRKPGVGLDPRTLGS